MIRSRMPSWELAVMPRLGFEGRAAVKVMRVYATAKRQMKVLMAAQ